ncbi:MAG: tRNA pseudouridine(38-40) synthase TruA [Candidatus Omnitrophica bacterium]|nr:tRNA pseudouridine(38-40) synthase TruA [Candidatus Omnitrophota bacterium]MBU1925806.1 tRNA pseudouridine(38-40) synthase TruA [Candidatus Omnitrophota bacterium]
MKNILFTIAYDGTNYSGWQTQRLKVKNKKIKTIQAAIEHALSTILQTQIKIYGSGRTDAGAHAKGQTANFKTDSKIPLKKIKAALNSLLPEDIRIKAARQVPLDFHARYRAKTKIYQYVILNRPDRGVFNRLYVLHINKLLDIDLMRKEARTLLGRHDFSSFQAKDSIARSAVHTIKKIFITRRGGLIFINIEADGFAYNMVRNIVGTLVELGRGKFPAGDLKKILRLKNRKYAGPTVPAKGLCLVKVKY